MLSVKRKKYLFRNLIAFSSKFLVKLSFLFIFCCILFQIGENLGALLVSFAVSRRLYFEIMFSMLELFYFEILFLFKDNFFLYYFKFFNYSNSLTIEDSKVRSCIYSFYLFFYISKENMLIFRFLYMLM